MPEKPIMKSRFKAEFSMGQLDYERYHNMLQAADMYAIRCRNFENSFVLPFYAVLKQLYANFRPIIFETKKKDFEERFKLVEKEINRRQVAGSKLNFPLQIFRILEEIHFDLLEIKQLIGLGIEVRKEMAKKTIMRKALVPDRVTE